VTGNATLCTNVTIREFIIDLLYQPNYPVVAVAEIDQELVIIQHSSNHTSSTRWNIPLFIHNIHTNETHLYWLLKSGDLCPTRNAPALNLRYNYIFNHQSISFVRINYSPKLFQRLLEEDLSKLDPASQLGLIQDTSAFEDSKSVALFLKVSIS
jgi:aminopeptidase N